ncbi:MAG TPA: DUF1343 domain-containing protein [Planctomycetota bacterium]|nr:DUF1343 domain-containing protein [Planctomycetota bacterium]
MPLRLLLILLLPFAPAAPVKTGLEVLVRDAYRPLLGKRVGLITNHSGIDASGKSAIDLLAAGKGFTLTALYSPEHGLRGTQDENVASGKDDQTGLPVHSLYGKTRKPTPEMLRDVDVLVFDIQDIGARYYTYCTTLALVMEAAKENGKALLVLDRPNAIGGVEVEGPVLEEGLRGNFIGYFALPTRHGMTVGELARLYNTEFKIGCRLDVVPLEGWSRSQYFDETGLPWVNPSPNMRSLPAAIAYPGLGALEGTNLSVGRGTDKPFVWYGAPWIDGAALCGDLESRKLPGVRWKPVRFTPTKQPGMPPYPHTDRECGGFEVEILDRAAFRPVAASLHVLDALYRRYPKDLGFGRSCTMIGLGSIETDLKAGKAPALIEKSWQADLDAFKAARKKVLLY